MYGSDEIIDLKAALANLARYKWLLIAGAAIGVLVAMLHLRTVTYSYTVAMKVTPVASEQSTATSRFTSLASLAGISLGDSERSQFQLYLDSFTARSTAEALMREPALLRGMFPREWSEEERRWVKPPRTLERLIKDVVVEAVGLGREPYQGPTAARVEEYLIATIRIREGDPITLVHLNAADRTFGTALLTFLNRYSDRTLQRRDRIRSQAYIKYLMRNIGKTQLTEQRAAYAAMISDQEKRLMVASSGLPYAAEVIQPPYSSRRPTQPNIPFTLIVGGLLGLMVAAILIWRLEARRLRRSPADDAPSPAAPTLDLDTTPRPSMPRQLRTGA